MNWKLFQSYCLVLFGLNLAIFVGVRCFLGYWDIWAGMSQFVGILAAAFGLTSLREKK